MSPSADVLVTNAHIFTADLTNPSAEAMAIQGNRIAFVGNAQEAAGWRGASTRLVDGGGKTLLPGFIDSHFHMLMGSLLLDDIHGESAATFEELAGIVKTFAAGNPDKPWLSGFGLKYSLGPGHIPLTRQHLDSIIPDRPMYLVGYDGHTAWANTLALQKAGIFNGAECGSNSEVVLDEHGQATGELRESGAHEKIEKLLPQPDDANKRRLLKKGLLLASSLGITSVHNMDGDDEQATLYAAFEDNGDLTVRVYVPYSIRPSTRFENIQKEAAVLKRKYQSQMVRAGSVKLFMDGVIDPIPACWSTSTPTSRELVVPPTTKSGSLTAS